MGLLFKSEYKVSAVIKQLWDVGLTACIPILIVLAARPLLKKYPKFYSYSLWVIVVIRLLCPVFPKTPFSLLPEFFTAFPVFHTTISENNAEFLSEKQENLLGNSKNTAAFQDTAKSPAVTMPSQRKEHSDNITNANSKVPNFNAIIVPTGTVQPINTSSKNENYSFALFCALYVVGVLAVSLTCLVQYLAVKCRISAAVRKKGCIWLCETVQSPFVIGVFRPKIILPYCMDKKEKFKVYNTAMSPAFAVESACVACCSQNERRYGNVLR